VSQFDDLFIHGEIYGAKICGDPFFPAADLACGARQASTEDPSVTSSSTVRSKARSATARFAGTSTTTSSSQRPRGVVAATAPTRDPLRMEQRAGKLTPHPAGLLFIPSGVAATHLRLRAPHLRWRAPRVGVWQNHGGWPVGPQYPTCGPSFLFLFV
jgi:hypothetical protein